MNFSFSGPLDIVEKMLLRLGFALVMTILVYVGFSSTTMKQITEKTTDVNTRLDEANRGLSQIQSDISKVNGKIQSYQQVIDSINNLGDDETSSLDTTLERVVPKDAIPNLLNRIMFIIPQKVLITSIRNTENNHIVIEAQAEKYEQLGYFKALIDSKGILDQVKSSSGTKEGNTVKVTIEGDLP